MKFAELVIAIVGLIGRVHDINLELTKRVAPEKRKNGISFSALQLSKARTDSLRRPPRRFSFSVDLRACVQRLDLAQLLEQGSFQWQHRPRTKHARARASFSSPLPRTFSSAQPDAVRARVTVYGLHLIGCFAAGRRLW
ncbi:MAG: hypothetical protein QM756_45730 [Polyangiaceae bacterium]